MRLAWGPDLIVGHQGVDQQHHALVHGIQGMQAKVAAGDSDAFGEALSSLADAFVRHFADEEALMEASRYPDRPAHKGAHDLFLHDVMRMANAAATRGLAADVVAWVQGRLPEWFAFHVRTNDAPLARYLAQWAMRPGAEDAGAKPKLV